MAYLIFELLRNMVRPMHALTLLSYLALLKPHRSVLSFVDCIPFFNFFGVMVVFCLSALLWCCVVHCRLGLLLLPSVVACFVL